MPDKTVALTYDLIPDQVVRRAIEQRVRLRFTERRPAWWQWWRSTTFLVTGPADVLDAVQQELQQAADEAWYC